LVAIAAFSATQVYVQPSVDKLVVHEPPRDHVRVPMLGQKNLKYPRLSLLYFSSIALHDILMRQVYYDALEGITTRLPEPNLFQYGKSTFWNLLLYFFSIFHTTPVSHTG
jgi:hypothetical protein